MKRHRRISAVLPAPPLSLPSWIGLVALGIALLVHGLDFFQTRELMARAASVETGTVEEWSVAPVSGAFERTTLLLPSALDARWYVIHADNGIETGRWRIRRSEGDHHPEGREVHWSTLMTGLLRGLSTFERSGPDDQEATARTAVWGSQVLLFGFFPLLLWPIVRCCGGAWGMLLAAALLVSFPFIDQFRAGEWDHHGLATILAMAMVAGAVAGQRPDGDKGGRWAAWSGLCGALGVWISAATLLPVVAALGTAAVLGAWIDNGAGIDEKTTAGRARFWALWGLWGGGGVAVFWALEYLPGGSGWRMEVIHPLYACAWLGAGWLIGRLSGGWTTLPRRRVVDGVAALLVLAPLAVVLVGGSAVFRPSEPFLLAIHQEFIREFASFASVLGNGFPPGRWVETFGAALVALLFAWVAFRRAGGNRGSLALRLVLVLLPAVVAQLEALAQIRWTGLSVSLWTLAAVVAAAEYYRLPVPISRESWLPRLALGLALIVTLWFPAQTLLSLGQRDGREAALPKAFVPALLLRDIAHRLNRAGTPGVPVVLSDPTSSTELHYFGGVRVLGTLYWENAAGLWRTAELLAESDPDRLRAALIETGVTHLVLPSWDVFFDVEVYGELLRHGGQTVAETPPFMERVLEGMERPGWLRPIHYPIPPAFNVDGLRVAIFAVEPTADNFAGHRHWAIWLMQNQRWAEAMQELQAALALRPGDSEIMGWLRSLEARQAPQRLPGMDKEERRIPGN